MEVIFFAIPKAFEGHIGDIQRNAITSWLGLDPKPRVLLFGDDQGVSEAAKELGVEWIPKIKRSHLGTPLLGDAFRQAAHFEEWKCLVYLNADIILPPSFLDALQQQPLKRFMATGRRKTIDVEGPLELRMIQKITIQQKNSAPLDPPHALDYFALFSCPEAADIPDFAVGRPGWDNWMIFNVLRLRIPVVDLTRSLPVLHQNHGYGHVPAGRANSWEGPEADANRKLVGARERLRFSIADATHLAHPDHTLRRNSHAVARRLRLAIAERPKRKWLIEILGFPLLFADRRRRSKVKKTD